MKAVEKQSLKEEEELERNEKRSEKGPTASPEQVP